jgi:hypothetical protein
VYWVSSVILNVSRGDAVGWGTELQAGRSRFRFPIVSLEFFINLIFPATLWPRSRCSLKEKWIPGKGGQTSCADSMEFWEPQPPRTFRPCTSYLNIHNLLQLINLYLILIYTFTIYRKRKMNSSSMTSQQYTILYEFAKQKVTGRWEWSGDVVLTTM